MKKRLKKLRLEKEDLTLPLALYQSEALKQMSQKKCKHGKSLLWCSKCRYKSGFLKDKTRDLIDDLKIPEGYKLEKAFGINKYAMDFMDKNKLHLEFDDE